MIKKDWLYFALRNRYWSEEDDDDVTDEEESE